MSFASRILAVNALTATNLPKTLANKSAPALKKIIDQAVTKFGLGRSWQAPRTRDVEELAEHLNELCNENGLMVDNKGQIVKA